MKVPFHADFFLSHSVFKVVVTLIHLPSCQAQRQTWTGTQYLLTVLINGKRHLNDFFSRFYLNINVCRGMEAETHRLHTHFISFRSSSHLEILNFWVELWTHTKTRSQENPAIMTTTLPSRPATGCLVWCFTIRRERQNEVGDRAPGQQVIYHYLQWLGFLSLTMT